MSRKIGFSVVIESPQKIEIGFGINQNGKLIIVTSIRAVEFVNDRALLVSGTGTV
ncbi:hypothetical protein [Paenibacillus pseudetheri]|uniref:Uncharacterized protein n=1 Tax=Paenibacillus pseudetheri TaxID=2897682 RepID=A0ABM9BB48_9BACL|nr:hypothetical protein [Paenibacillus pseudetheri]CAH1055947.1 hypothetical protein PAECIP111894_02100 [Paenibacillus pseudetheri]